MKIYLKITALFLLVVGCYPKEKTIESSFYHWQQQFDLTTLEQDYLRDLKTKKLYVRFFDVTWNEATNRPQPVSTIHFKDSFPKGLKIIPTIYITNQTIGACNEPQILQLAQQLYKKIQNITTSYQLPTIQEIQIDCDWSLSTKDKFFKLLEALQTEDANLVLSATIRLHQVKFYKKTGIPPVQRGMLMFYNMGDLQRADTKNSILDLKTAKQYLVNFDEYDLPLDVALPLFRWGVLKRRGRVVKLINHLDFKDLQDTINYSPISNTTFQVKTSHYLKGYYLYPNHEIRIENVQLEELQATVDLLKKEIQNQSICITYYHLDEAVLAHYTKQDLIQIEERFK